VRAFFLGFPGCETQSVFCFLKGRTSSFLQSSLFVLIQPCLGKIIFSSCKSSFYLLTICALLCWYEVSVGFLFHSCSVMVFSFSLNIVFLLVGFSFFLPLICRRCFVCIYHLIHSSLVLFILGVLGLWEFLWRAGSYFASVWGSALWSVGPVLFIWVLAWGGWRGCTGFLLLGSVEVGMVRLKWWGGGLILLAVFSLLSALSAGGCLW
jgi:hypothetical protein